MKSLVILKLVDIVNTRLVYMSHAAGLCPRTFYPLRLRHGLYGGCRYEEIKQCLLDGQQTRLAYSTAPGPTVWSCNINITYRK